MEIFDESSVDKFQKAPSLTAIRVKVVQVRLESAKLFYWDWFRKKWVLWLGTMSGLCNSCISKQAVDELGPEWIRSLFSFFLLFCSYLLNHYGTGLIKLIFWRYAIQEHRLQTPNDGFTKHYQRFWAKIGHRLQPNFGFFSVALSTYFFVNILVKVQILWEGNKIWKKKSYFFILISNIKTKWGDLQGVSHWNVWNKLAMTDIRIDNFMVVMRSINAWGYDILIFVTSFQKINIGWPYQPPTESKNCFKKSK